MHAKQKNTIQFQIIGTKKGTIFAIIGPCFGYFYDIFASRCLKRLQFSPKSCMQIMKKLSNVDLFGPQQGHVWSLLVPCLGNIYNIFTFRSLKWLKFSVKSHACQIEEYSLMLNCWDHIMVMSVLYQGYFYNFLASLCLEWLFFYFRVIHAKWIKTLNVEKLRPYQGHLWLISEPCFGHLYHIYTPKSMKWLKSSLKGLTGPTGNFFIIPNKQDHVVSIQG